jgi:cytochrome subunit of sulfide dehydrogenase
LSDRTEAAARWAAAFLCAVLVGAGMMPAQAAEAPPGAASCSGCHPANANADTPVPRLAGQDAGALVAAVQAFRSGQLPATVMDRIAKGFSDDETAAIAAWFLTQR